MSLPARRRIRCSPVFEKTFARRGALWRRPGLQRGNCDLRWLPSQRWHLLRWQRPDAVQFSRQPGEDVKRRDFTINGMMLDPVDNSVLDFVGGMQDLQLD